jgi:hypothetical protein
MCIAIVVAQSFSAGRLPFSVTVIKIFGESIRDYFNARFRTCLKK